MINPTVYKATFLDPQTDTIHEIRRDYYAHDQSKDRAVFIRDRFGVCTNEIRNLTDKEANFYIKESFVLLELVKFS